MAIFDRFIALQLQQQSDSNPLSCRCKSAIFLVELFVELAPQNLKKKQNMEVKLPLHWAAKHCYPQEVIFFFIDQYPESLDTIDCLGRSSLHHDPKNSYMKHTFALRISSSRSNRK